MATAARRALQRVVAEGRFTAQELADVASCSVSAIYKASSCLPENPDLCAQKWELIARYLCGHGERRVSAAFISPDHFIVRHGHASADGRVEDEFRDLVEVMGARLSKAHREKNRGAFDEALEEFRQIGERLSAEGALLG